MVVVVVGGVIDVWLVMLLLLLLLAQARVKSRSRKRAQVSSTPEPGMYSPDGSPRTQRLMAETISLSSLQPME